MMPPQDLPGALRRKEGGVDRGAASGRDGIDKAIAAGENITLTTRLSIVGPLQLIGLTLCMERPKYMNNSEDYGDIC